MPDNGNINSNDVKKIPPELLSKIPGGQPPPGIVPNFENPASKVPVILGVGILFLAIACFCFCIRIYTKVRIAKRWQWDDLMISLGFLFGIVYFAVATNGCINGLAGKHLWEVHLDKVFGKANLYQSYITVITATPALGLVKLSFFVQYYLLFKTRRYIRISVYTGAIISGIFYIAVTIAAFVLSSPWPGETILDAVLSWHFIKFTEFSVPTGVIGTLVDCVLFVLPIPAVWNLQLSLAKRLNILVVFMTGGLAVVASITTLYYRVQLQRDGSDTLWKVGFVLLWTQVEIFAGITASSMPTVRQFFRSTSQSGTPEPAYRPSISITQNFREQSHQKDTIGNIPASKKQGYMLDNRYEAGFNVSGTTQESFGMEYLILKDTDRRT